MGRGWGAGDLYGGVAGFSPVTVGFDITEKLHPGWKPIGNPADRFTGTFDGQDYTIKELYAYRPEEDSVALFGATGGGSEIRNLRLRAWTLQGKTQPLL